VTTGAGGGETGSAGGIGFVDQKLQAFRNRTRITKENRIFINRPNATL
jgi:hypothetical protein